MLAPPPEQLARQLALLLLGAALVLLARVVLLGRPGLLVKDRHLATTLAERIVLTWGGLRGALTITLALAMPPETPERELLVAMSFGVVLFTLLVQGMSLPLLLRQLGLVQPRRATSR
jgi:CPA1 family monovalent cation:H+ antiporter